ncbi:MAG: tripartite tricarboxylate transporter substrate binding protein [Betaproteobacteria bacterium]|nr:tripartite tricarboxylate transporter substrate binding protein [Betaproteobacteria bacterium]
MQPALIRVLTVAVAVLLAHAGLAPAQPYPSRPIRVIVPYAPGGSTDVVLRLLAPRMSEILGQQVVVENRPGAASVVGLDIVAKSPPDGYTVGIANIAYGANPTLRKMPFDSEKDLVPVSLISIVTMVLSVHPSVPSRSMKQLIALAKSKPGSLNYGSAGQGSANHLAMERFKQLAGINVVHIPYQGGGPAVISIVGGETALLFATIPSAIQHFKTGRLIPLGVSRAQRNVALPDVPTIAEAAVPGYEAIEWNGAMVPAGTPAAAISRLHQAIAKSVAIPAVKERVTALGADLAGTSPAEFTAFVKKELATWSRVVKEVGIRVE